MEFKKCNTCGKTLIDENKKCPYCGSSSFTELTQDSLETLNREKTEDYNKTRTEGSIGLGIILGLFLGFLGFIISCISIQGKENGKTIKGTVIGVLIQCALVLIIIFSTI